MAVPEQTAIPETTTATEPTATVTAALEPMEVNVENRDGEMEDHWESQKGKKVNQWKVLC